MNPIFRLSERLRYRAVTVLLAAIAVAGALGTPEFSQIILPQFYHSTQEFWTGRQMVYAERDIVYTNSSQVFLEEMLTQPQAERILPQTDESLRTALRKMVARRQRALEKANLLHFKYERIKRNAALAFGTAREPQPVEGF